MDGERGSERQDDRVDMDPGRSAEQPDGRRRLILRGALLAAPAITMMRSGHAWAVSSCGGRIESIRQRNNNRYRVQWHSDVPADMRIGRPKDDDITIVNFDKHGGESCLASFGLSSNKY